MSRAPDPRRAAAIADLLRYLKAGANVELVRSRYATVSKASWSRWKRKACAEFAAQGSARPALQPPRQHLIPRAAAVPNDASHTVEAMSGPKEMGVSTRWTDPPEIDAHDALALVDRLGESFLDAKALADSTRKRVGAGHVILDPAVFAAAVDLQRKAVVSAHEVLKDSRNLDSIRRFLGRIVEALAKEEPEYAAWTMTLLRKAAHQLTVIDG